MKLIVALTAAVALVVPGYAAPCRNQAGKFVKCDPAGAKPTGAAAAQGNISKDKNGKCHIVKPAAGQKAGQFARCGYSGRRARDCVRNARRGASGGPGMA